MGQLGWSGQHFGRDPTAHTTPLPFSFSFFLGARGSWSQRVIIREGGTMQVTGPGLFEKASR